MPASAPELEPLVTHVVRLLSDSAPGAVDETSRPAVEQAVRGALAAPMPTRRELSFIETLAESKSDGGFDELLTERVRQAVSAGAAAVGQALESHLPELLSTIMVARGDGLGENESAVPTLAGAVATLVELPLMQTMGAMLTAEGGVLQEISNRGRPVHLITNAGGESEWQRTLEEGPGIEATHEVDIHVLTGALARLEEHLLTIAPPASRPGLEQAARGGDIVGQILDNQFRIERRVGRGGFGTVYKGRDLNLGRDVAVKVLNPKIARNKNSIRTLQEEAQRLAKLDHPNIVRVYAAQTRAEDGLFYLVMEMLAGSEVNDVLSDEGPFAPERAGAVLLDVLKALRYAHELPEGGSLLHLDLKPQNVFLVGAAEQGAEVAKVIDFGIGQHVGKEEVDFSEETYLSGPAGQDVLEASILSKGPRAETTGAVAPGDERSDTAETKKKTTTRRRSRSGSSSRGVGASTTVVRRAKGGTVLYASPEQCRHLRGDSDIVELDGRADIYSLGVFAFKMITGEFPFSGRPGNVDDGIRQHLEQPPRKIRDVRPAVGRRLATFVDTCLEKDVEDRWQTASEAHDYLEAALRPLISKKAAALTMAALVAPLALLIYIVFFRVIPSRALGLDEIQILAADDSLRAMGNRLDLSTAEEVPPVTIVVEGPDGGDAVDVSGHPALFSGGYSSQGDPDLIESVVVQREGPRRFRLEANPIDGQELPDLRVHIRWGQRAHSEPFVLRVLDPLADPSSSIRLELLSNSGEKLASFDDLTLVAALESGGFRVGASERGSDVTRIGRVQMRRGNEVHDFDGTISSKSKSIPVLSVEDLVSDASAPAAFTLDITETTGLVYQGLGPYELRVVPVVPSLALTGLAWSSGTAGKAVKARRISGRGSTSATLPVDAKRLVLSGAVSPFRGLGRFRVGAMLEADLSSSGGEIRVETPDQADADPGTGEFEVRWDLSDELVRIRSELEGIAPGESRSVTVSLTVKCSTDIVGVDDVTSTYQIEVSPEGATAQLGLVSDGRDIPVPEGGDHLWIGSDELVLTVQEWKEENTALVLSLGDDARSFLSQRQRIPLPVGEDQTVRVLAFDVELLDGLALMGEAQQLARLLGELEGQGDVLCQFTVHRREGPGLSELAWDSQDARIWSGPRPQSNWPAMVIGAPSGGAPMKKATLRASYNGVRFGVDRTVSATDYDSFRPDEPTTTVLAFTDWAELNGEEPWPDGEYRIEVQTEDLAGFKSQPSPLVFHVDSEAPTVEFQNWSEALWVQVADDRGAGPSGRWVVEVAARDGNGISAVQGDVVSIQDPELKQSLEFKEVEGSGGRWRATLEPSDRWSFHPVAVKVWAIEDRPDGATAKQPEAPRTAESVLPQVRPHLPPRKEFRSNQISPMKLVYGPSAEQAEDVYEFAGEYPASAPIYLKGNWSKRTEHVRSYTWPGEEAEELKILCTSVQPYYLDESEVSVGQYATFLEARDGYANSEWWLDTDWVRKKRRSRRRSALQKRLANLDRAEPVTGVFWEEAAAYAAWAGKRLPSALEWEWAVRGDELRVHPMGEPRSGVLPGQGLLGVRDPSIEAHGLLWPL